MVLVSNEWPNKDDEQKPDASSTTPAPSVIEVNEVIAVAATPTSDILETSRATISVVAAAIGKRKRAQQPSIMDTLNIKTPEQDQLFQIMENKYEIETAFSNKANANESHGHNDIQVCDSNTNTLQNTSSQDAQRSLQLSPVVSPHLLSSVNANTSMIGSPGASNLFGSMGGLSNCAINREPPSNCGSFIVAPSPSAVISDLNIDSEIPSSAASGDAKIVLQCEAKSHKFETRSIPLQPNQECKVGRLIAKSKASEGNAIFDCKVLSRNHAMLWYTADGRFWVKDTKSSNGTFINDNKLGNDPAELHYGDIVKFGVEVIENSRQEVHGCIIARVTLFLPDGREAISFESDQLQLTGPNRISLDEIQRLNSFLQEAAQREKTLKAKLSSLQGVLDSTRKNSAMCWQSMITEDQLLHKINLLEKKLQVMEKNVPENALRNEVVKLLEDKTTYQLTAKEALRKVYQERCDAMQMLSKMEMAYTTSENECGILRAQILTSKQTMQDFNVRLEQLQQEYVEYKQESLRQQHNAKEQEETRFEMLKNKMVEQERQKEELCQQITRLHQAIAEHDNEQKQQEKNVLEQLDAVILADDELGDDELIDENDNPENSFKMSMAAHDYNKTSIDAQESKIKELKKNETRKSSVMKLLKNSDLSKGEGSTAVLKAIFDAEDDLEVDAKNIKGQDEFHASEILFEPNAGLLIDSAAVTNDEFTHNPSNYIGLNSVDESKEDKLSPIVKNLSTQNTLVSEEDKVCISPGLPTDQALEMLQEECEAYKQKTVLLTDDICFMHDQIEQLKTMLENEIKKNSDRDSTLNLNNIHRRSPSQQDNNVEGTEQNWYEETTGIINPQEDREEELVVYKEKLEESETSNMQLRKEILQLRLKLIPHGNQVLMHRILPIGCVAFAALLYFIFNRI
ncbi:sarcolemmal membrane-associated protein [Drosophila bipectinata]|uniref:sarcolemmal membrane-associated protein n=1 Tax=Drosophila bipectinata TaxID=42026 RepID=UPI001C8952C7|nr:sarcolemmal membrane-associated protein [Drosophila bipectinata]XP_017109327.2 sarcolemmal membrane-associated protein [Drosophila bipectinata]